MIDIRKWNNNFDNYLCVKEFYDRVELKNVGDGNSSVACILYENYKGMIGIVCGYIL